MSDKFDELVKIWNEAENESLSAEAILNQVQDGECQAAIHILRSWKLLGLLNVKDRADNAEINRIDSFDALQSALDPASVVVLPEKRKEQWASAVKAFFALDPGKVTVSAENAGTPFEGINILDASDDLNDTLRSSWKKLKCKYGKTLLQRLHLSGARASLLAAGILVLLYIVPSLYTGFWNPAMWLRPRVGQFVLSKAQQEWGTLGFDRSVDGKPLSIGNVQYPKGLGTHAVSTIRLIFPSGYTTFTGACGLDDEAPAGSITCQILSDGKVLFQTPVLRAGTPAQPFSIDINGLGSVELVIGNGGDGKNSDHADWVNLELR